MVKNNYVRSHYNYKATSTMHSLIQHVKSKCDNRDSLSLFVEYCGGYQIRVHRQFYNYVQFESFFVENENIDRLDYRDITNDIGFPEFNNLLIRLLNKRNLNKDDELFLEELLKILHEIRSFEENNGDENDIDDRLNRINDVFCKYRFSINDNSFVLDERIYNKINDVLKNIQFNHEVRYEDYKDWATPEIESVLEKELYELRIFNVGQANCSALIKYINEDKDDYRVIIVFDLGFQRSAGHNQQLDEMLSKIDCDTTILISHYDSDHINNISDHLYITTGRWIFPNYDGKGKKALKTFQMLMKVATKKTFSGTVYNFPTPFNFSPNISVHQYMGSKKADSYQSTLMNSKCLVCKLSIGGKDILIPADALYEEFGDELVLPNGKKYDYILVPHHGCKYINKTIAHSSLKIWKYIDNNTVGFVMCGKNSYGHANVDHLSWFSNKNIHSFKGALCYKNVKNVIASIGDINSDFYSIIFI